MKIKSNFGEALMIYNEPVEILCFDNSTNSLLTKITMRLPTYRDILFDEDIRILAGLLNQPIDKIAAAVPNVKNLSSHYSLFTSAPLFNNKEVQFYAVLFVKVLKKLNIDAAIEIEPYPHYTINNIQIDENLFDEFVKIFLVSLDFKKESEFNMDPQQRALEEKINRIKRTGNKQSGGKSLSLLDIYTILTYEFNYSKDEILNMTMYMVNYLLSLLSPSINYKISLIAKGNGLSKDKKLNFITDLRRKK